MRLCKPGALSLDDTALQLYKGGDYGAYLDLEASINEQQEEFEGFYEGERVLRNLFKLPVYNDRGHFCPLNCTPGELFSCMPPEVDPIRIDPVSLRAPCDWTPDNHGVDNRKLRVTRIMKDI
ncbi:microtubule-associated protein futsch isoform x1 [Lasius niger]|uniref:Microtubule-associated protein futsch isoform x1 n=1 Tax=Lasius niger TaxID=67767 RepID=A0A0J7P4G0_LASNI|nr:microtubule-associated protein futsch isoform x1 [Lasius niger]